MENQSGKYFQSIEKLHLHRFIDCLVDENYYALVISGEHSLDKLKSAFALIQQQYSDAMGDSEYKHYHSTYVALTKVSLTIIQVEECIESLKLFPFAPLFDELNNLLKTDFKFDYSNKTEYFKLLKRAYLRSRGLVIQRDLLQIKFDSIKEKFKGDGDKKITRAYFIDWLILLSNHVQTTITDQITVYEFCERIRQYNQYVERGKMRK